MKEKLRSYWELFWTFFKIGLFSFGGGYGMLSIIERAVVTKHKWLTNDEMLTILAVAESTPGPIAVNTATYVGEKKAGIVGGIVATLGVVLPSFLIIFGISFVFTAVKENKYIMYAFKGIRVAVIILIFNAFVKFFKKMDKNVFSIIVMIALSLLTIFTTLSTIYYLLISAVLGVLYFTLENSIKRKKGLLLNIATSAESIVSENGSTEGEKDSTDGANRAEGENDSDTNNCDGKNANDNANCENKINDIDEKCETSEKDANKGENGNREQTKEVE